MTRRRLIATVLGALTALLALGHAVQAGALSCEFYPFQPPGQRFGTREMVAYGEVLEVQPDGIMTARVLRVLHGREDRPVLSVDTKWALGWNMPQQWGFEPFSAGTRWLIVFWPAFDGRAAWQPELCRAFLKVEGDSAVGFVHDLGRRERVPLDSLAAEVASPQGLPAPTTSK